MTGQGRHLDFVSVCRRSLTWVLQACHWHAEHVVSALARRPRAAATRSATQPGVPRRRRCTRSAPTAAGTGRMRSGAPSLPARAGPCSAPPPAPAPAPPRAPAPGFRLQPRGDRTSLCFGVGLCKLNTAPAPLTVPHEGSARFRRMREYVPLCLLDPHSFSQSIPYTKQALPGPHLKPAHGHRLHARRGICDLLRARRRVLPSLYARPCFAPQARPGT